MSGFSPSSIDAILFDLDGTLIDSRADLAAAVNAARNAIGRGPVPEADVVRSIGDGLSALLNRTLGAVSSAEYTAAHDAFQRHYESHCVDRTVTYAGVAAGLATLSERRRIGVVTNKPKGFTDRILERLKLSSFVNAVVGGDSLSERKPDPAPVYEALRLLGARPARSVMVGDGSQDVRAGQAAGLATVAVRYGYGFSPDVALLKPTLTVETFNDLLMMFEEKETRI